MRLDDTDSACQSLSALYYCNNTIGKPLRICLGELHAVAIPECGCQVEERVPSLD
jgi:hypothetical protein